jgi:hypothetical protein
MLDSSFVRGGTHAEPEELTRNGEQLGELLVLPVQGVPWANVCLARFAAYA